jgi:hypothetical protein
VYIGFVRESKAVKNSLEINPVRWIIGGLLAVTLYFQTNLTDPFNSPKMWILLVIASWLLGYIVVNRNLITDEKSNKITTNLIGCFIFTAFLVSICTDSKYTAFFGEMQRRNGFFSYFSLSIIFLATSMFIRSFNIIKVYKAAGFVGIISVIYALMQTSGRDFVKWSNPYNSIITTLGNPNFAAAVMAIVGVLIFSLIFVNEINVKLRILAGMISTLLLISIYLSDAKQGLLSFGLGIGIFLIIWIRDYNKNLGLLASVGGFTLLIFSILGMLQMGPLERFLYKQSVTVRGYYWRAGVEMFKDNPIIGVGMDRYGSYFKEYRLPGYPLSYGFDLTSTNAHNTFIQFFATGGVFLGSAYLILNVYVLKRAIFTLNRITGSNRVLFAGIFSAWVAFHSQSLVSIDNVGVSIWGWVLGGSIIGLSISVDNFLINKQNSFQRKSNQINLSRVAISGTASLIAVALITLLYRGEVNTFKAKINYNLQDQATQAIFKDAQLKAINTPFNDPSYKFYSALDLIRGGFVGEGVSEIKNIYNADPRNLDALNALSAISEQSNNLSEAIINRKKMAELDPWNAANYLALGKNYKAQGDTINSKRMLDKIISFAPNHPIAAQAKIDLAP